MRGRKLKLLYGIGLYRCNTGICGIMEKKIEGTI